MGWAAPAGHRSREARTKVMVPSRMRLGTQWGDVCIHNISSRGMMVRAAAPPEPGTYVDIRRGTQTIIGRVVWRKDCYFGIRSQDRIDVAALVSEPRLPGPPPRTGAGDTPSAEALAERRSHARLQAEARLSHRADRARHLGATMQFGLLLVATLGAGGFLAFQAHEVIARPMAAVSARL